MDENLVGYLLKALDVEEQREVEAYLRRHPQCKSGLRSCAASWMSWPSTRSTPNRRRGSRVRTLAHVVEHTCQTLPMLPPAAIRSSPASRGTRWRRADVLVAACLLVLVGGLGLPLLARFAERRHIAECADNLHQFQVALSVYADQHEGQFPRVESQPPRNFAGSFIPALNEAGVLPPRLSVSCPGSPPQVPAPVSFQQLDDMRQSQPEEFRDTTRSLAGCYAYSLGYRDEVSGEHHGLTQALDGRTPIMSDAPSCQSGNDVGPGNSPNHDGRGQHVLLINGSVRWSTTRNAGIDNDDIFLNADQRVGAGRGPRDTVLGRSDAVPYPGLDE